MFKTQLGDETLTLCDEGGLDASAGFALLQRDDGRVWDDAEVWERNRTVRRLNRIRLDHLAFVPNPAYRDARVERPPGHPYGRTGAVLPRRHPQPGPAGPRRAARAVTRN